MIESPVPSKGQWYFSQRRSLVTLLSLLCFSLNAATSAAKAADKFLPELLPESTLQWHSLKPRAGYRIALGPVTGYRHINTWLELEGRLNRAYYRLLGNQVTGKYLPQSIYQQYHAALLSDGFELLAEGYFPGRNLKGDIGGLGWLNIALPANPYPLELGSDFLNDSSSSNATAFLAARRQRPQGDQYLTIALKQRSNAELIILIDQLLTLPTESGLRVVKAQEIAAEILDHGRVILNGLDFAPGSEELTPNSSVVLKEIAQYLSDHPDLNFYVVGHTDNSGAYKNNLSLSLGRARHIVMVLTNNFAIDAVRLEAQGVGPLSPLFNNESTTGREKNRRVELVQR